MNYQYEILRMKPDDVRHVPAYVLEHGGVKITQHIRSGEYFIPVIQKSHFHDIEIPESVKPVGLTPNPNPDLKGSYILTEPDNKWFNTISHLIRDLSGVDETLTYDPSYATNIVAVYHDALGLSHAALFFGLDLSRLPVVCYKAITDISVDGELSVSYGLEYWNKYNAKALHKMGEYVHIANLKHRCYGDGRNCTSLIFKLYERCIDGYYHYKKDDTDVSSTSYSLMDKNHVIHTGFDYYYRSDATLPAEEICVENNIFNYMGKFHVHAHTDLASLSIRPLSLDQKIIVISKLIKSHPDILTTLIEEGHVDGLDNVILQDAIDYADLTFIRRHVDHLDPNDACIILKRSKNIETLLSDPIFPSVDTINSNDSHIITLMLNGNSERIEHIIRVLRPRCYSAILATIYNYRYGVRSNGDNIQWSEYASIIEKYYTHDIIVESLAQTPHIDSDQEWAVWVNSY